MSQPSPSQPTPSSNSIGFLFAVLAYGSWGLLPIYWKLFGTIPAVEVLSHRMIWSMVFLLGVLFLQKRLPELAAVWASKKTLRFLIASACLLAMNWGLYIYGVNTDRVVETSLGYYINPLLTVMLGMIFLKERLNRTQWFAVGLAALGVINFIVDFGQVPWIALGLAFTFGLYGLLRKIVAIAPMVGLAVETIVLAPLMLVFVTYWQLTGYGHLTTSSYTLLIFIGAGVVTSMPLLWFNNAAKRLRLSTMGFFQYIAPSLQLILGVFLYAEPFTRTHAVTFACIWTALAIYSANSFAMTRQASSAASD
ncbi:MAG: EamA family transporter RarD [Cyanobacteria bacterium P01_E01_bin.6]